MVLPSQQVVLTQTYDSSQLPDTLYREGTGGDGGPDGSIKAAGAREKNTAPAWRHADAAGGQSST